MHRNVRVGRNKRAFIASQFRGRFHSEVVVELGRSEQEEFTDAVSMEVNATMETGAQAMAYTVFA